MRTQNKPLVAQELDALYTGPLRDQLNTTGMNFSFGKSDQGTDIDVMAFDTRTNTALIEVIGSEAEEVGRVIAYGRGREIVFHAVADFTREFGTPATFDVVLSDQPEPPVHRGGGAPRIHR